MGLLLLIASFPCLLAPVHAHALSAAVLSLRALALPRRHRIANRITTDLTTTRRRICSALSIQQAAKCPAAAPSC